MKKLKGILFKRKRIKQELMDETIIATGRGELTPTESWVIIDQISNNKFNMARVFLDQSIKDYQERA